MRFLLSHLLENAAEKRPDATAIQIGDEGLTYSELNRKANRLARWLWEHGVRPGCRVGIFLEKSLESVIGIYGAMKAGAAYVPIDINAPAARARFIAENCKIRHLITSERKTEALTQIMKEPQPIEFVVGADKEASLPAAISSWEEVFASPAAGAPSGAATEFELAYILYTSGSTGVPKGIMHTHRSALAFVDWAMETFTANSQDRFSSHAPFQFDLSIFDLFVSAAVGGLTVLIPEPVAKIPASLSRLIQQAKLTVWYSVPYALIQLLNRGCIEQRDLTSLRCILFAGEQMPNSAVQSLRERFPEVRLANLYGPTETNVCTHFELPPGPFTSTGPLSIGRPCFNTEVVIANEEGQPVSKGSAGELLVRGPSVMRGYCGAKQERALEFWERNGEPPFYRTGDLVQQQEDGNLRLLGRKDHQIKLRGYRIELSEIEHVLCSHSRVQEAAAYLSDDELAGPQIEAAVVFKDGVEVAAAELLTHLAGSLPAYVLPARIRAFSSFPRTSTGKVDRRALVQMR
jgi:amino acid adenylation domain-containing protein